MGVNDSEAETAQAATRSLPDALKDIEGALSFQPSKDWYLSNLASKSEVKTLSLTDAQQIKLLNALAEEQTLMQKKLSQLQGQIFSQKMVNSIADKVAERVRQQTTYPLILQPVPNSPAAP